MYANKPPKFDANNTTQGFLGSYFFPVIEPILTKRFPMTEPRPEEYFAMCSFFPKTARVRLEDPSETEERYEAIRKIYDDITQRRYRKLLEHPPELDEEDVDVTVLYKTKTSVASKLNKSTASLSMCRDFLDDPDNLADFKNVPANFFKSLSQFLDHKTLLGARLVCRRWNKGLTSDPGFLDRTLYLVNDSLDFVERCKTQVSWPHVKSHFFPTVETSSVIGYHAKYLVNKLHKIGNGKATVGGGVGVGRGGESQRQFFLLSNVSSLILVGVELNRDIFLKWLTSSSGALKSLALISCTLKRPLISRAGLNGRGEKQSVSPGGGLREVKGSRMSLTSLIELLKLVQLLGPRNIKVLEVGVRPTGKDGPVNAVLKSKLETELSQLVGAIVADQRKTLESLEITVTPFQAPGGIPQFFHELGHLLAPSLGSIPALKNYGFVVIKATPDGREETLVRDRKEVGFTGAAEVDRTMENLARCGSGTLKRINVPFWTIQGPQNLEMAANLSILLPKLSWLGAQFEFLPNSPDSRASPSQPLFEEFDLDDLENLQKVRSQDVNENYRNLQALQRIERLSHAQSRELRNLCLYSSCSPAILKKAFPWLKELELSFGAGGGNQTGDGGCVTPTQFQDVIKYFPKLVSLVVSGVKGFQDVTLTGVEPRVMQVLKEKSLASKGTGGGQGLPIWRMRNLRTLRIRGEMDITDVGILHGFAGMKHLEILELSGSPLSVSGTGLNFLAENCPQLREVIMSCSKWTVTEAQVEEVVAKWDLLQKGCGRITVV